MKKATLYFIAFSFIASILNYCLYPFLGRILPPDQYVNITVALSLFTQIGAFLSSIIAITIGVSKAKLSNNDNTVELLQGLLFRTFAVLSIAFLCLSPLVMEAIHTPTSYALPIVLMLLFSIPLTVTSGYLNGKNLMIKLGGLTLVSAALQFTVAIASASITDSGLLTMFSLTASQLLAIIVIYSIYRKDNLPSIRSSITVPHHLFRTPETKSLIIYTIGASLAIMLISLVQVIDLLTAQSIKGSNLKLFTDIYVVSRAVFFAGMIFIWPFLGEITLGPHRENMRAVMRLLIYFTLVAVGAVGALYFFGDIIFHILFGANYSPTGYLLVGFFSITFKFLMLLITAAVLYLVVRRHYAAIYYSVGVSVVFFLYAGFISKFTNSLTSMLVWLNILALFAIIVLLIIIVIVPRRMRMYRV